MALICRVPGAQVTRRAANRSRTRDHSCRARWPPFRYALAAALAGWAFLCPAEVTGVEAVRFRLATRLAVARLPWLWGLSQRAAVAKALQRVLATAGWIGTGNGEDWQGVQRNWDLLLGEGLALRRLEEFLRPLWPGGQLRALVEVEEDRGPLEQRPQHPDRRGGPPIPAEIGARAQGDRRLGVVHRWLRGGRPLCPGACRRGRESPVRAARLGRAAGPGDRSNPQPGAAAGWSVGGRELEHTDIRD